jgi:hypothetical protein
VRIGRLNFGIWLPLILVVALLGFALQLCGQT